MSERLNGKVAIVTGAASGFGRATAIRFASEGARVVVADLNETDGEGTVVRIGSAAQLFVGDIADLAVAQELVATTVSSFGSVDILVNNAGISHGATGAKGPTWDMTEEQYDRMIRTNLRSVYACSKAAIPKMIDGEGGCLVNVASIAVTASVGGAAYGAAKGGMLSYTRHLAAELASKNVRANCVSPGFMRTPMSTGERDGLTPKEQEGRIDSFKTLMPMGRVGSVDDIANAILFLASDEASYITGQELIVDGGYLVR